MKEQLIVSRNFKIATAILICIGILTFILGLLSDPGLTWANYLIVNYYFLSLAMGGLFFFVIQNISQSGWASGFQRVSEAIMMYIPFASVFFLILFFGVRDIYHWANNEVVAADPVLQHKSVFLNIPFYFIRMIIYFSLWIIFILKLRKISLESDKADPDNMDNILRIFSKTGLYSKILIFILIITFSFAAFEWMMSIDAHWYSTIFALKNLVAAFLHGVTVLTLIVFSLYKRGYFPFLNKYHLHDFARYIFMLSIIWGYFWFAQFMIIWYGNIPEETAYFYVRWQTGWKVLFFCEIGLNWAIPFMVLLPVKTSRNMAAIVTVIIFLIIGQYVDLFVQVIPGVTGALKFGWIEAGLFLGYAGLFSLIVAIALSRAKILPRNHPYLEESLNHKF
jgi:hypothetical protein